MWHLTLTLLSRSSTRLAMRSCLLVLLAIWCANSFGLGNLARFLSKSAWATLKRIFGSGTDTDRPLAQVLPLSARPSRRPLILSRTGATEPVFRMSERP